MTFRALLLLALAAGAPAPHLVALRGTVARESGEVELRILAPPRGWGTFPEILAERKLGPGRFQIRIEEPEKPFLVVASGPAGAPAVFSLRPPNSRYRLNDAVRLEPWREVEVTVRGVKDAVLPGARVDRLLTVEGIEEAPLSFLTETSWTTAEGKTRVRVPPDAESLRILVSAPGHVEKDVTRRIPKRGSVEVLLNQEVEPELERSPDEHGDVEVRITPPPTHPLWRGGCVGPPPGKTPATIEIRPVAPDGPGPWRTLVRPDMGGPCGGAGLRADPRTGPGEFEVRPRGWLLLPEITRVTVPAGQRVVVEIAPTAAAGIRIVGRDTRGRPLEHVTFEVEDETGDPAEVFYRVPETAREAASGKRIADVPNEGVAQVRPGRYVVRMETPDGHSVEREVMARASIVTRVVLTLADPADPVRVR